MNEVNIVAGMSAAMFVPIFFAILAAMLFWYNVVPRQLKGLQVAFPTGEKKYEVHVITPTTEDARRLLSLQGVRFGVTSYLMALTGSLILFFEYLTFRSGSSSGYHAPSLAFALILIALPAIVSSGTSLGAQVIRPLGTVRATMQSRTTIRSIAYVALSIAWLSLSFVIGFVLHSIGYEQMHTVSIAALVAFSPAILAYGRILGSSWQALKQSSAQIGSGKPSPFHNHVPNARQQLVAQIVHLNLLVMPFVAINTLISLIVLLYDPSMFTHSQRVLELPEYRIQSTFMEEGGLLGFGLIELFSHIPQPEIRVPIVTSILLFLLFNVAIVGFLFVYEVARILFLDIQDVAGVGGIRLADSRLLRAEPSQQANVLNFCFTGFAGQSMVLLALAMITFWDSSFLPQGSQCGSWETNVCAVMEKNMLEQLTWMLAACGQIAFLVVWSISWRRSELLEQISFDASMDEDRTRMRGMSDLIFVKQRNFSKLIEEDDWQTAIKRYESFMYDSEQSVAGINMERKIASSMFLYAALGRFDQAEEDAINLIAFKGGNDAIIPRLMLCTASLAQRDYKEAKPRLALLPTDNIECVRVLWVASLLNPKRPFPQHLRPMLAVDPVTKKNIHMIRSFGSGEISLKGHTTNTATSRRMYLAQIARLRLLGRSEEALDSLEVELKKHPTWIHGKTTQSLLNFDAGRVRSAVKQAESLAFDFPRHPHVRALNSLYANLGHTKPLGSDLTGMQWETERSIDWRSQWRNHNIIPAPQLDSKSLRQHAWNANAWVRLAHSENGLAQHPEGLSSDELPLGLYTHIAGIMITIQECPLDLGLPGNLNLKAIEKYGLLDLSS